MKDDRHGKDCDRGEPVVPAPFPEPSVNLEKTLPEGAAAARESPSSAPRNAEPAFLWLLRRVGSLKLAVFLLTLYLASLVFGTAIEKQQGAEAARRLVYGDAWFIVLNALLAVNILAAMLVRFPWRPRQAGFVVTHAGILVLLAGCWMTWYAGVEAQLPVYEGHANRVAYEGSEPFDLGFQVYLHKFQRRLNPGTEMASHYASVVDFLDVGNPPKKLRENVLITLNAPVDFTDPQTGRTYRLFQSSFSGPWLPGDPEFDQLVGGDRSRDRVYLSRFSVNYDPGRWLKYLGSLLILVGIAGVYYAKRFLRKFLKPANRPETDENRRALCPPVASARPCLFAAMFLLGGTCSAGENAPLDWREWRRLPAFGEGRVAPLDTVAREAVELICGRKNPRLVFGNEDRTFASHELLFSWLVEPEKWERTPFLIAEDAQLRRDILGLPVVDANHRRLRYASPAEVESNAALGQRWAELNRRADIEGKDFRLRGLDKKVKDLVEAYGKYRLLTFQPASSQEMPRRFYLRARLSGSAWRKLAGSLQANQRIRREDDLRRCMVEAGEALQKLIEQIHGSEFSLEHAEPPVTAFCRAADELAARLVPADDKPLAGLAANLRHQAHAMHLALYDDGGTLRLVPALDAGALEEGRMPSDDASPWLSFQAMIYGSDDLLREYPRPQVEAVRSVFARMKAAYLDRNGSDRPLRFARASQQFSTAVRALGEAIHPLREKLPIQHRDPKLMEATAYPPEGGTDAEVLYGRLNPFFWAWTVSLAATLCLLSAVGRASRLMFWLGVAVLFVGQAFTLTGMGLRGWIMGLVPLTGMFETVVFVAMYAALLGLWFGLEPLLAWKPSRPGGRLEQVLQRRWFILAGAIVSFVAAILAYYAPATVMRRNIGAVTPILRDNFWLAVHVVTIMASYASAAIGLILGNIALGYYLLGRYRSETTPPGPRHPPEICSVLAAFIYRTIKITVLLLAAGTILGALWADKSWGRFWAWDPKEVWALISLLAYLLILHMRYIGWSGDFGMSVTAVFGFTAILFTWYGVNFLLASGMHAYGSGAGGQWQVASAVALQWLFLAAAAIRYASQTRSWKNSDSHP